MCGLGKGGIDHFGGRVVYLVHKKGTGVVRENPREVAVRILENLATRRIRRLGGNADFLDSAGIGTKRMHVNLLQKYRTVGDVFVNHRGRGHLGHIPLELNDLAAHNPLVARVAFGKCLNTLHALLEARAIDKIDGEIGIGHKGALCKMRMRIDDARHDELIAIVAHLGIGPDKSVKVLILAARNNPVTRDGNATLERGQSVTSEHSITFDD